MKSTAFLAALALLAAAIALATGGPAAPPPAIGSADATVTDEAHYWDDVIVSFDGVEILITVFKPAGAGAAPTEQVPVILHSHGWGGTRTTSPGGMVGALVDAGYGAISIDARGHGDSGGKANVHHRDVEVRDFQAVLDYAYDLDWVLKDEGTGIDRDVVAGAVGGSYGGGYQLMTASFDARLDALVPQMTWNDLTYSLAPNGALKTVWVLGLYGLAQASGTRVMEEIDEWFIRGLAENRLPDAAFDHFKGSSPEPQDIRAHVLLQQSFMDTLFNANEGFANYRTLRANAGAEGYEVALFTYLGGHISPTGGFNLQQPDSLNTSPCGDMEEQAILWFDRHLRGMDVAPPAGVSYALETGDCIERSDAGPDRTITARAADHAVALQGAGSIILPLRVFDEETVVAGIPTLGFTAHGLGDSILHASLLVAGPSGPHVINHQIAGLRFETNMEGGSYAFDLNGIATRFLPGDVLTLRLDAANEQYALTGNRVPGVVLLEDVTVTLPVIDG